MASPQHGIQGLPADAGACAQCDGRFEWDPAWNHVHRGERLPGKLSRDDRRIQHGYAVGVSRDGTGQMWLFFPNIEPALAFGRAARSSDGAGYVHGYGVYRAASEVKFDRRMREDVHTLHLTGAALDRGPGGSDELALLHRWVAGLTENPDRTHWFPPNR